MLMFSILNHPCSLLNYHFQVSFHVKLILYWPKYRDWTFLTDKVILLMPAINYAYCSSMCYSFCSINCFRRRETSTQVSYLCTASLMGTKFDEWICVLCVMLTYPKWSFETSIVRNIFAQSQLSINLRQTSINQVNKCSQDKSLLSN